MKLFSVDGGIYKFMTGLWNIVKINFLWIVFSIPIVTLGGATIAAFDVTMKMVKEEEGYVAHQFVKSFKKNFKDGIVLGILFLLCMYVVWLDFSLFNQIDGNPLFLLIIGIVTAYVFLIAFLYAFPLRARYENSLINTLRNSANISLKYFLRTLSLIFVLFVEFLIIFWNYVTMFVGALIGPACMMLTISGYAVFIFRKIEKEPDSVIRPDTEENEDDS